MKRLWLVLLFAALVWGQRENTVYQNLFTNQATDGVNSSTVRNIGQSSHLVTYLLSDAPAATCASPANVDMGLEYSYDNVTYIRAAGQITRITANDDGLLTNTQNVAGAYPYVRVAVRDFDTVNCRLRVDYSGAVAAFNVNTTASTSQFLGINAISTLGSSSGLNIQRTPSAPIISDMDTVTGTRYYRSVWDAMNGSAWTLQTGMTVQASHTRAATASPNCISLPGTTMTFGDTDIGQVVFTIGGTGTGYSGTSFQCDWTPGDLTSFLNSAQNFVDISESGGVWTWTSKAGGLIPGAKGNFFIPSCSNLTQCQSMGLVVTTDWLENGSTFWKSQITPQGLQACVEMFTDGTSNIFRFNLYDSTCTTPLTEFANLRIDRGLGTRMYIDDYQIFSFVPGTDITSIGNTGVMWGFGVPYIPDFVGGVTEFIWFFQDNKQNTTVTAQTWRRTMRPTNSALSGKYGAAVLFNGSAYEQSDMYILTLNPNEAQWVNTSGVPLMDAVIVFELSGPGGADRLIGQLWNAMYYQVNTTCDFDFVIGTETWRTFTCASSTGSLLFLQP